MPIFSNNVMERLEPRRRLELDGNAVAALKKADALLPADKMLIELTFKNRLSRQQIGRILSIPAGTVCRRLQRLSKRMNDPLVKVLLDPICPLPPEHRQLAIEHFLQGQSARQLGERHQLPDHHVRRMLEFVKGWHRGVNWTRR